MNQPQTILLIDGMNLLIRCFSAVPTCNLNGLHFGIITGFFNSLVSFCKLTQPDRIYIVFDGRGGSYKRRFIFKEYKENRKNTKLRLNRKLEERKYGELIESVQESLERQTKRLGEYLSCLPVIVTDFDGIEADDVIAYLSNIVHKDDNKVIVSNDKDFQQLASKNVKIYSPSQKKFYGVREVANTWGVMPCNLPMLRAFLSDQSDNIPGISGIGPKTALKIPLFKKRDMIRPDDVLEWAKTIEKGSKLFKIAKKVIDNFDDLSTFYQIMELHTNSMISAKDKIEISKLRDEKVNIDLPSFLFLVREDNLTFEFIHYDTVFSRYFYNLV